MTRVVVIFGGRRMIHMFNMFMPLFATGGGTGGWQFGDMLSAVNASLLSYVKVIVAIIGLVMVCVAVYQIAKNLISHGKGQTNWVVTFALLIVGGALMVSNGWSMLVDFSTGGRETIDSLSQGNADSASVADAGASAIISGDLIRFD